jgi:hypothetical protein
MFEAANDFDLSLEPPLTDVGGDLRAQDLHGNEMITLRVVGEKDVGGAAFPDFALKDVALG